MCELVFLGGIMDCGHWIQFGFWSDVQQDLESSRDISKCYQYEKGNYKYCSLLISLKVFEINS